MRQKDPLRPLTKAERRALEQLARSHSAPALSVARARALLAVSDGCSYTDAAHLVGRSVGDSIAKWVAFQPGRVGRAGTASWWSTADAVRSRRARSDPSRVSATTGPRARRDGDVVVEHLAPEARRIARKLEFHPTPKHGSWLNVAECELAVLTNQCLNRRLPTLAAIRREVAAWELPGNADRAPIRWLFTTAQARRKLSHVYPIQA
jgi:hypothetical protein